MKYDKLYVTITKIYKAVITYNRTKVKQTTKLYNYNKNEFINSVTDDVYKSYKNLFVILITTS